MRHDYGRNCKSKYIIAVGIQHYFCLLLMYSSTRKTFIFQGACLRDSEEAGSRVLALVEIIFEWGASQFKIHSTAENKP